MISRLRSARPPFSGFYLPLMALGWLLILRGIAIDFRDQIQNAAWERLWDVVFSPSSTLVVISFGAALGNRGPRRAPRSVGHSGLPFWNSFSIGPDAGILDGFTLLAAASAFLTWRNTEPCGWRSKRKARWSSARGKRRGGLWWACAFAAAITVVSFRSSLTWTRVFACVASGFLFPPLAVSGRWR